MSKNANTQQPQQPSFDNQMFSQQIQQPSMFNFAPQIQQVVPTFTNNQMFAKPVIQPQIQTQYVNQPTTFIQQPPQQLQSLMTINNGNMFGQLQATASQQQQQQQSLFYSTQNDFNEVIK